MFIGYFSFYYNKVNIKYRQKKPTRKSNNHIIKSHAEENILLGVFLSQIFSYSNHYLNKLVYLCRNI